MLILVHDDGGAQVELKVLGIHCISRAGPLPIEPADAARSEAELAANEKLVGVAQDTRLDHRVLDLRTPANQAIFRVQSAVGQVCFPTLPCPACCAAEQRQLYFPVAGWLLSLQGKAALQAKHCT